MAPISFKDMISVDYRPGEPEEIKYYAQKRRKQYHGNESKDIDELSMKRDRKLPNLKIPVKGKKGVSKYMRKAGITSKKPYDSEFRQRMVASVQSADRKPEKYIKPDGKVGIRMVKTDKEVIKKEQTEAIKHTHAVVDPAGKVAGMTSNERDAKDIARRHKGRVIKLKKPMSPNKGDMMINRPFKEEDVNEVSKDTLQKYHKKSQDYMNTAIKTKDPKMMKNVGKRLTGAGRAHDKLKEASLTVKDAAGGMSASDKKQHAQMVAKHGAKTKYSGSDVSYHGTDKQIQKALHIHHPDKDDENRSLKYHKSGQHGKDYGSAATHTYKEEVDVDEALNLQQRMKRSRLMKRLKTRIKIGRDRARRKMANKKTLEKRAMRQARAAIAKKLTRGIPKAELTFARKQEIEKRLDKPALKSRIKRIAKRIFKDVRKKEVQRKKG